jgi:hypothetical protein
VLSDRVSFRRWCELALTLAQQSVRLLLSTDVSTGPEHRDDICVSVELRRKRHVMANDLARRQLNRTRCSLQNGCAGTYGDSSVGFETPSAHGHDAFVARMSQRISLMTAPVANYQTLRIRIVVSGLLL